MNVGTISRVSFAVAFASLSHFAFARSVGRLAAYDIGEDLAKSAEGWDQSADDFAVEHGKNGFQFADNRRRNVVVCRQPGAVTFFGAPVMETRVYFKSREVSAIELSLYNKGDAAKHGGAISKADFDAIVKDVSAKLTGEGRKVPDVARVRVKNDRTKMGHKFSRRWQERKPPAELTWGVSGEHGAEVVEFVKVAIGGAVGGASPSGASSNASSHGGSGKTAGIVANVKRNDEGDVYVANVPMVDQGEKGYCSAAAAERVLRYFGQNMDEHEIAQIAGTTAEGGTSVKEMISAVETIGKKCKLGKREIVSKLSSLEDGMKRVKAYNAAAKRMKKPDIRVDDYVTVQGNMRMFDFGAIEQAMEPKVLKAMSMKDKAGYGKFIKGVRDQTNRGVPLFWSVRLGVYPEPGIPQKYGGHMRLIIGYNEERNEVIYTDTWGAGHELKHMPDDWAWTITHNLFYLNPR